MKVIEKTTSDGDIQIFEIIESRKELRGWIRDAFWDSLYSQYRTGIWEDGDSNVVFYDKDGKCHCFYEGDAVKRFNISNIDRLISGNDSTVVLYGNYTLEYNEHYGDWNAYID